MKKLIGKVQTTVVDHKGNEYTPVVYDLGYDGNSVIFEATTSHVKCGCWGVDSLLAAGDKMYLDFGSRWYVTGLNKIKEELRQFL